MMMYSSCITLLVQRLWEGKCTLILWQSTQLEAAWESFAPLSYVSILFCQYYTIIILHKNIIVYIAALCHCPVNDEWEKESGVADINKQGLWRENRVSFSIVMLFHGWMQGSNIKGNDALESYSTVKVFVTSSWDMSWCLTSLGRLVSTVGGFFSSCNIFQNATEGDRFVILFSQVQQILQKCLLQLRSVCKVNFWRLLKNGMSLLPLIGASLAYSTVLISVVFHLHCLF